MPLLPVSVQFGASTISIDAWPQLSVRGLAQRFASKCGLDVDPDSVELHLDRYLLPPNSNFGAVISRWHRPASSGDVVRLKALIPRNSQSKARSIKLDPRTAPVHTVRQVTGRVAAAMALPAGQARLQNAVSAAADVSLLPYTFTTWTDAWDYSVMKASALLFRMLLPERPVAAGSVIQACSDLLDLPADFAPRGELYQGLCTLQLHIYLMQIVHELKAFGFGVPGIGTGTPAPCTDATTAPPAAATATGPTNGAASSCTASRAPGSGKVHRLGSRDRSAKAAPGVNSSGGSSCGSSCSSSNSSCASGGGLGRTRDARQREAAMEALQRLLSKAAARAGVVLEQLSYYGSELSDMLETYPNPGMGGGPPLGASAGNNAGGRPPAAYASGARSSSSSSGGAAVAAPRDLRLQVAEVLEPYAAMQLLDAFGRLVLAGYPTCAPPALLPPETLPYGWGCHRSLFHTILDLAAQAGVCTKPKSESFEREEANGGNEGDRGRAHGSTAVATACGPTLELPLVASMLDALLQLNVQAHAACPAAGVGAGGRGKGGNGSGGDGAGPAGAGDDDSSSSDDGSSDGGTRCCHRTSASCQLPPCLDWIQDVTSLLEAACDVYALAGGSDVETEAETETGLQMAAVPTTVPTPESGGGGGMSAVSAAPSEPGAAATLPLSVAAEATMAAMAAAVTATVAAVGAAAAAVCGTPSAAPSAEGRPAAEGSTASDGGDGSHGTLAWGPATPGPPAAPGTPQLVSEVVGDLALGTRAGSSLASSSTSSSSMGGSGGMAASLQHMPAKGPLSPGVVADQRDDDDDDDDDGAPAPATPPHASAAVALQLAGEATAAAAAFVAAGTAAKHAAAAAAAAAPASPGPSAAPAAAVAAAAVTAAAVPPAPTSARAVVLDALQRAFQCPCVVEQLLAGGLRSCELCERSVWRHPRLAGCAPAAAYYKQVLDSLLRPLSYVYEEDDYDAPVIYVNRSDLLGTSISSLMDAENLTHEYICVSFEDEMAYGDGVVREWLTEVAAAVFDPNAGLFRLCEGDVRALHLSPAGCQQDNQMELLTVAGRVIGLAMRAGVPLGFHLSTALFKLLQHPGGAGRARLGMADLAQLEPRLAATCAQIAAARDVEALGLTFVASCGQLGLTHEVPLLPGGKGEEVGVTAANRRNYLDRLLRFYCTWGCSSEHAELMLGGGPGAATAGRSGDGDGGGSGGGGVGGGGGTGAGAAGEDGENGGEGVDSSGEDCSLDAVEALAAGLADVLIGSDYDGVDDGVEKLAAKLRCVSAAAFNGRLGGEVGGIDVGAWRSHTSAPAFKTDKERAVLEIFWEVVSELQNDEQRRLLQFWTGISHLPAGGFKHLSQQLQLVPARPGDDGFAGSAGNTSSTDVSDTDSDSDPGQGEARDSSGGAAAAAGNADEPAVTVGSSSSSSSSSTGSGDSAAVVPEPYSPGGDSSPGGDPHAGGNGVGEGGGAGNDVPSLSVGQSDGGGSPTVGSPGPAEAGPRSPSGPVLLAAHTCFFQLRVPLLESKEAMRAAVAESLANLGAFWNE